ncbi:hypothetical protein LTR37_000757 [Vermiconidia calcicola]|uniref:Uncharacterized protein n=1 Tax=Vermiconidia calcicola TaxID=1690605 RepID=A0ACC3P0Z7_9PEZI|nr:hypothetical protein LTR37_000757 [Vermiconidia calcicola]
MAISIQISNRLKRSHVKPRNVDTQTTINLQSASRLFALPVEIRLQIYELVLSFYDAAAELGRMPIKNRLSILQTCRRVLHEAEAIYCSIHYFGSGPGVLEFDLILKAIGPRWRNALTSLTVRTSSPFEAVVVIKQLHALPNLKSCYFERQLSVRDLGISDWSLMAKWLQAELAKLEHLQEVKMITPEVSGELTDLEEKRREELRKLDAMLERG